MYSFKYHLLTICAVFLALAVGLLLGSAIGGSGLLSATTSDLVDSLSSRFTNLDTENTELSKENSAYESISTILVDYWDNDRLEDCDVMIMAGSSSEQNAMAQEIADYVSDAGGQYVIAQVNLDSMGLEDEELLASVQELLPAVDGQNYLDTLADALVLEWTAGVQEASTFDGGRLSTDSALSDEDQEAYPLTCFFIEEGILALSNSSNVPDTINCFVDTLLVDVSQEEDDGDENTEDSSESEQEISYEADPMGIRIASAFHSTGAPTVLTQDSDNDSNLMDEASSRGLAGVDSYSQVIGRYSIIYLLSTGQTGVYGMSRDQSHWYPS